MTSDFERYTQRLIESVSGDADVLGLVLIGSTADASYRDARSDHDFWLVVTDGAAARYRAKNAWLPNADSILCSVEHGAERRSILFRDGHMVEYAVFTPSETSHGKLERFRVVIDRGGIADLVNGVAVTSVIAPSQRPEPLQNLALIVWTGQQHLTRGERLSAHKYLTQFAVDALLELLRQHAGLLDNPTADRLDPRRRLEQCAPAVAAEFERALARPLSQVGPALLALAEQRVRPAAPHLNWAAIAEVRRWLADA